MHAYEDPKVAFFLPEGYPDDRHYIAGRSGNMAQPVPCMGPTLICGVNSSELSGAVWGASILFLQQTNKGVFWI